MPLAGNVVVKTELNEIDAEAVAGFLRSRGVPADVKADHALPSVSDVRGVCVLVAESDADRAREFLASYEEGAAGDDVGAGSD